MNIVDAHHHLWNLAEVSYPWLRERGVRRFFGDPTPIQQDYGVAELKADHARFPITRSVHVQVGTAAGKELDETEWLDRQAQRFGLPSAIVAYCDLTSEVASATLQAHLASSALVRGVRQIVSRHRYEDEQTQSAALLGHPGFEAGLAEVERLGLSFDLQLTPPHMLAAARLFRQFPNLRVALCHAGSPWGRSAAEVAEWRDGLEALAELPNMFCKLSGLGMFDGNWTPQSLRPIVDEVIRTFGTDRVMWGSNFPVDKLYRSYEETLSVMMSLVDEDEHALVFAGTAERFYRI